MAKTRHPKLSAVCKKSASAEAVGAVRFQDDVVHAVLEIESGDDVASAFVRAKLEGDAVDVEILHVFDVGVHAWLADSPDEHVFLLSGGLVSTFRGGAVSSSFRLEETVLVDQMVRVDSETLAFTGEEGVVITAKGGVVARHETGTKEDISAIAGSPGTLVVGGSYATLLRQKGNAFIEVPLLDTAERSAVTALLMGSDGVLRVGFKDGSACLVSGDEVRWLSVERDADAELYSGFSAIVSYDGVELWGDDDHGVMRREGQRLVKALATGYAFGFHALDRRLTIHAAARIVLVDGGLGGRRRSLAVQPKVAALLAFTTD